MPVVSVNLPTNVCRRAGPPPHLHHDVDEKDSVLKTYPGLKERIDYSNKLYGTAGVVF